MIAIIPAAGRGTRMAELTGGRPKELLKLGRMTVLERVIREAETADPKRIVVVSSSAKEALSEAAVQFGAEVVLQESPFGLVDAIMAVQTDDDALVLFGDCVYQGGSPVPRMASLVYRGIEACVAVESVTDEETRMYGIVELDSMSGAVKSVLEKPGPEATSSRWAVAARYALGARFMSFLAEFHARYDFDRGPELSLTPVINAAVEAGFDFKAVPVQPGHRRVDCGSPEEYRVAMGLDWS